MKNKKAIIIITSIIVLLVILFTATVIIICKNNKKSNTEEGTLTGENTKIADFYDTVTQNNTYTFTTELDENNKTTLIVDTEKSLAYKEEIIDGDRSVYIVKDGSTYLLDEEQKEYYRYDNNEIISTELLEYIEEMKESEASEKTEKINGTKYNYVEVNSSEFVLNLDSLIEDETDYDNAKTRLYFKNNELKYIKTIMGEKEELLEVKFDNSIESSKFEIPSNYKDATSTIEEDETNESYVED